MTNLRRSRQADLVDRRIFDSTITIIGCGAIGSFTALTLAKMGFHKMKVYDNDRVSEENISNQFYRYMDIGMNKALALNTMLIDFENVPLTVNDCLWTKDIGINTDYVIMAVDSMAVRTEIYESIRRNVDVQGFIDGRMGGQQAEVYTVDLAKTEQKQFYTGYLWSDSEASELPCTQKAVMYNVLWIASGIANSLRLMAEQKPYHSAVLYDFENQAQTHINIPN